MKNLTHHKWAGKPLVSTHITLIPRAMKLTFFFAFAVTFLAKADGMAQNVTIRVNNERIEKVFSKISEQTKYDFFYDAAILEANSVVSLSVENESIDGVLKKALKNTPYEYKISSGTILISSRKSTSGREANLQQSVTGTVMDADRNPLVGATVGIVGQPNADVKTNEEGRFSITATKGNMLSVSYVGFQSKQVLVESQNDISIQLESLDMVLGEVV